MRGADSIGWLVYESRLYEQLQTEPMPAVKPEKLLGKASAFRGLYQLDDSCDGEVYSVTDMPNLLFIKLNNTGEIILKISE